MTSKEEPRVKYTYTFFLQAKVTRESDSEESAGGEVQEYINQVLGIKNKQKREDLSAFL